MFVSFIPSCLCFSPPSHPFLQGLIYFNQVSIYSCEVTSLFSINVLIRWSLVKMLTSSKFIILHFFSSPVDPIQAFSVDHIPFLVENAFSCRCTSQSLTSCYSFVPECWRYLRRFACPFLIRSSYLEIVISFKPFNSTGAISISSNHFNVVSFEWALTHKSFPRILPDSSNFSGVILKFIAKYDVKEICPRGNNKVIIYFLISW